MPAVGEVRPRRMTVDDLVRRFGVRAEADASEVTLTSIARHSGDVTPGCLFVPAPEEQTPQACRAALLNGAYAILLPTGAHRRDIAQVGLPVLTVDDPASRIGPIAAYLNGDPSKAIAVFVAMGPRCDAIARRLGGLLHHLGNPIGLIGADGASSLGRPLDTHGLLNGARLQFLEAVMAEDGVTALVIAADPTVLRPHALAGTQIDVLFDPSAAGQEDAGASVDRRAAGRDGAGEPEGADQADTRTMPGVDASAAAEHAPVFGARLPLSACISSTPVEASDPRFAVLRDVLDFDPVTASAVRMAVDAGISVEAIARAERVAREFEPDQAADVTAAGAGGPVTTDTAAGSPSDAAAAPEATDTSNGGTTTGRTDNTTGGVSQ